MREAAIDGGGCSDIKISIKMLLERERLTPLIHHLFLERERERDEAASAVRESHPPTSLV